MLASILITFRETLEAALVVGIVLSFLTKTNQTFFKKFVWRGTGIGIVLAILVAIILQTFFGGFVGRSEQIFEGILMFTTVGFLTWMIMWVHKQKDVSKKLKEKVALHAKEGYGLGIVILVASSVFREGVETSLYLKASSIAGASNQLLGAAIGILAALALGYGLFRFAIKVNISMVFNITGVFLLLFGAGLLAHGVHEFQEANLLPIFSFDPLFNISNILDHTSTFGSLLRVMFGYTSKPTSLELVSYCSYIAVILWVQRMTNRMLVKHANYHPR